MVTSFLRNIQKIDFLYLVLFDLMGRDRDYVIPVHSNFPICVDIYLA